MPRPRFQRLPEEKQAHILAVAREEFAEHGFEGASYNRIIERAGLSKGAMYYYFDDKTDLYGTVVQAAFGQMMAALVPRRSDDAEGFWVDFLADYRDLVRFAQAHPELLALTRGLAEHPERLRVGPLQEVYQGMVDYTAQLLDRGQALGAVRVDLERELLIAVALALGEAMDGWMFKRLDGLDEGGLERLTAQLVGLAPAALVAMRRPAMWTRGLRRGAAMAVVAGAAALAAPAARAGEVEDLLAELDDMWRERSSEATVEMNVKTANYERGMRMKAWSKGRERSLIRIERPLKEKDTATLKSGDDIYTYLPKTDRTIRLTSGMMMGSWMGSHFTNDDLVKESRLLDDYTAKAVGTREVEGHRVLDIELLPKEDAAVVWGKIKVSVDTDRRIPVAQVYFDEDMKVARTMTFSDVQQVAGKLRPMKMRVVPADKPSEYTELIYSNLSFDVELSDAFFSLGSLRKR